MSDYKTVNLEIADAAAVIELNRPDRLNAWNDEFGGELSDVVSRVAADKAIRAVMITGAGRAFSSRADWTAEMALLGERVPASQALEWGMVNRVLPDEQLRGEADALLDRLAHGPTIAYANAKRLLNRRLYGDFAGQLEAEAEAQREQGL